MIWEGKRNWKQGAGITVGRPLNSKPKKPDWGRSETESLPLTLNERSHTFVVEEVSGNTLCLIFHSAPQESTDP
jgi:hypothetical protein